MPIYEYQCPECSTLFEEWLKTSECDLAQTCPNCQAKAQRVVSQTSFVLKGSGWYVTEYGTNSASSDPAKKNSSVSEKSSPDTTISAKDTKAEKSKTAKTSDTTTSKATTKTEKAS